MCLFPDFDSNISDRLFERLRVFVQDKYGIHLSLAKRNLLIARLSKRVRNLKFNSIEDYSNYLFSRKGEQNEWEHFINAISTNKTEFFREAEHFEYLTQTALPTLLKERRLDRQALSLWSAGCSSGEEAYTLAIVLSEYIEQYSQQLLSFRLIGSDVSTEVLDKAKRAVYQEDSISDLSNYFRKKYFLRNKDPGKKLVRVSPEIRQRVQFCQLNLMDETYPLEKVDVIFFRNVIIYFNRQTQLKVLKRMCKQLNPGGYLFLGMAESVNNLELPLKRVAVAAYRIQP